MKNTIIVALFSIFLSLNAQNLSSALPVNEEVRMGVLPNGMQYYIMHNGFPKKKVELRLAVNAGSLLENEDQQGLAHFMEHMNFNGTKNFPKNKLVGYLQSIGVEFGADINAYTSFDETVYMLPIPLDQSENLDNGLLILEDWAFNALLNDQDINDERGVILEESRLGQGAQQRMRDQWLPVAFKDSRYAIRLPIGKEEIIKTFKPETLREYYKEWYRPDLMSIIVVGDINVDEVEQKIKNNFGKYPNPKPAQKRKYYSIPDYQQPNIAIVSDEETPSTEAQILYFKEGNSIPMATVNDYRNRLKENLFVSMINARYQELANSDEPPFNYAYSFYDNVLSRSKRAFGCQVSSSPEVLSNALKVVLEENQRVKQSGFLKSELDRAKAEVLSGIESKYHNRDKIDSKNWAAQFLNHFLTQSPIPSISWEYETIQSLLPDISLEEVNSLINQFIQEQNYSVIVTGSQQVVTVAEVSKIIKNAKEAPLPAYQDDSSELVLMRNKLTPGKIEKISQDEKMNTTTLTLDNGVKIIYKKTAYKNDEILFNSYSYGGYSLVSDETWRKVHFAMKGVSQAGLNGLSMVDLSKVLAGKNAQVSTFIDNISEGMNGSSSNKDLETLFQLIHLNFTKVNFNENAFESFKQKQQGMYGDLPNNPEFYFSNQLAKFSNQNNPRNPNILPLEEDWKVADYKLAYEVYQQRFANPADFTFFFVGSIEEDVFKELATTYLGSLKTNKNKEEYKDKYIKPLQGLNEEIIKKGTDTKALLIMSYFTKTDYDRRKDMSMKMIADIISIRLVEKLREEEGGIYTTNTFGSVSRGVNAQSMLSLFIPTGVDQLDKMRKLAVQEVQEMKNNGPSTENLNKVKQTTIAHYTENKQTNAYWLGVLFDSSFYQEDATYSLDYQDFVNSFTEKEIQSAANQFINEDQIVGILMPEVNAPASVILDSNDNDVSNIKILPKLKEVNAMNVVNRYLETISSETNPKVARKKIKKLSTIQREGYFDLGAFVVPGSITDKAPNTIETIMDMTQLEQGEIKITMSPKEIVTENQGEKTVSEGVSSLQYVKGVIKQAFYTNKDIELKENIRINDKEYYVIKNKNTEEEELYNSNTGLLEIVQTSISSVHYQNYKVVNDFILPFTIITQGQQTITFSADKINLK